MEFYVVYMTQPNRRPDSTPISPSGPADAMAPGSRQDKDGMLVNPWKSLHKMLILMSARCDWDAKCIPSHERLEKFEINGI